MPFIVIDGPDGSGKSLHARLLAERLEREGRDLLFTEEPTAGPVGQFIRTLLAGKAEVPASALQILFVADRAWHVEHVIQPALAAGKTVVSDRYVASTIAYGAALGLDEAWLTRMNDVFPKPDLTIFTLPPLDVSLERISRRKERDILEEQSLQSGIHNAYRRLAEADPAIVVIDTSGEKTEVAEEVWGAVSAMSARS